ncbi:type II secretion system protein N [Candidatus Rhodobacter oscarellae]|uniref:type II secretion system protein N n=1 Tax=Candidatus Rhodobacter oscarellae TaxID=1675527 RepID=UPI0013649A72|nr:type II secretion system protein N [Candidatus Rhodobacter lobularis]
MRLLSGLFTSIAVAALGFACGALGLALLPAAPDAFSQPERAPAVEPILVTARDVPDAWPAVFGVVPEVAPEPEPLPEPETAEAPPEENTTYWLTGIVAGLDSGAGMAMLAENDRNIVVKIGDTLIGGETVTAIDARGVWIEYDGKTELIPVQRTRLDGIVQLEAPSAAAASDVAADVSLVLEQVDRETISALLAEAGQLEPPIGGTGMNVARVRPGHFYAQMGLRPGDTIMAVNGAALTNADLLSGVSDEDLNSGALELDILRDGARQIVRVTLDQG